MEPSAAVYRSGVALLLLAAILAAAASSASAIGDKCAACKAVALAEWIKTSSTESGNVGKALCEDISKHCRSTSATIQIDDEL
ncbi:hypothetical protein PR202_gb06010 [Eleusine coracana subsp. coracana]|uniref:Saposin B-type domain-containing protein n=1 Tax=Eleusine coracana subsp. coracana TaxID=191504 RepID=A0AAV5E601_ELECO|nr:hypothetical protein PR202_gb06010 [Eleusine coracana subsp. coracana]